MDSNVKERLVAAIRDYQNAAQHIGSAKNMLQALEAVRADVEAAPNPVSQGVGSMPTQRPGASGQREEIEESPGQRAAAAAVHVHVHAGPGTTSPREAARARLSA